MKIGREFSYFRETVGYRRLGLRILSTVTIKQHYNALKLYLHGSSANPECTLRVAVTVPSTTVWGVRATRATQFRLHGNDSRRGSMPIRRVNVNALTEQRPKDHAGDHGQTDIDQVLGARAFRLELLDRFALRRGRLRHIGGRRFGFGLDRAADLVGEL